MSLFSRFIPKEVNFYGLLERVASFAIEGAHQLQHLLDDYTDLDPKLQALENLEHACDRVTYSTINRLNESFITPFDREDIHHLVVALDDVLDRTEAAAQRMQTCRIKKPTEDAKKLCHIIVSQTIRIHRALHGLRDIRNYNEILDQCMEIHRLEKEADITMKHVIGKLFDEETNPVEIIKLKEVYENLETVTDRCEAVANIIQGIAVKMH